MNRAAIAASSLGLAVLAGCSASAPSGTSQAGPTVQPSCNVIADGYTLTLTNPGSQPVQVTGFAVTFTSGGQETGSDTEPGNATITDADTDGPTLTIGMNDWIAPGSSFTYDVQPEGGMPAANSCQLADWADR